MGRITKGLVRFVVLAGLGGTVASMAVGCATTAGGSPVAAMTPAEAAQVADSECIGIPAKERELGLVGYGEAITGAQPLKVTEQVGKVKFIHDRGVAITMRAQSGMSAPWLARVAVCHIAWVASGRGGASASGNDPLLVPGASVRVDEAYTGFVISVRVPNDAAAAETMSRTHALLTGPSGPATAQLSKQ